MGGGGGGVCCLSPGGGCPGRRRTRRAEARRCGRPGASLRRQTATATVGPPPSARLRAPGAPGRLVPGAGPIGPREIGGFAAPSPKRGARFGLERSESIRSGCRRPRRVRRGGPVIAAGATADREPEALPEGPRPGRRPRVPAWYRPRLIGPGRAAGPGSLSVSNPPHGSAGPGPDSPPPPRRAYAGVDNSGVLRREIRPGRRAGAEHSRRDGVGRRPEGPGRPGPRRWRCGPHISGPSVST